MPEKKELFELILERVEETRNQFGDPEPQAFGRWFINMYFQDPHDVYISDGSHDGKVDIFFTTHNGKNVDHYVINTKFTREYNKLAPAAFYPEIVYFCRAFANTVDRDEYLENAVKDELRSHYRQLFECYDAGAAHLMFVTNHRRNDAYYSQVKNLDVQIFHLDELIQHLIDDLDLTMPRTPDMILTGIRNVLSPDKSETGVSTSIVFARLVDFIQYMKRDPYDLLFARNVRVKINFGASQVNREVRDTFREHPEEFAFSNNGITMLCERHIHNPGDKELTLVNPRIVNGSQTLHSIRDVPNPSPDARVMVRIIEIPAIKGDDLPEQIETRKDVLNKISIRSNQQNPIKKWDLVSNDDFQLGLYRYFRQKGYFYERRDREWSQRSRQLRSVGIERGPGIKRLTQLIASFYWNSKKLGPAIAKSSLGELFEGEAYDLIHHISPELAYQTWLVGWNLDTCYWQLAKSKKYIANLRGHIDLTLFALIQKVLRSAGARWGNPEFTQLLEQQWDSDKWWTGQFVRWRQLTKACVDYIRAYYDKENARFLKTEGYRLAYANYFKSQTYIATIMSSPVSSQLTKLAKRVLDEN